MEHDDIHPFLILGGLTLEQFNHYTQRTHVSVAQQLDEAIRRNKFEAVEQFVLAGLPRSVNINALLQTACYHCESAPIISLLIAHGADVNAKGHPKYKRITLHCLCSRQHISTPILRLLLKEGANPLAKDKQGKTARDYVNHSLNNEAVRLLKNAESKALRMADSRSS